MYLYEAWFFFTMRKLKRNIKGSSKIYNMNMIDSPMIGQKRSMLQAKIWYSRSKWAKLDPILNQSLVLRFKEEKKN